MDRRVPVDLPPLDIECVSLSPCWDAVIIVASTHPSLSLSLSLSLSAPPSAPRRRER
jgi:hypothetical protein